MTFDIQKLLENKTALYVVLGLSVANLIGYMSVRNDDAVIMFFVLGVIASYFSKNMIVIMGVPLLLVSLYMATRNGVKEGMEGKKKDEESKKANGTKLSKELNIKTGAPKKELADMERELATSEKNIEKTEKKIDSTLESGIDRNATVEQNMETLQQFLGSDGIKKLSADTEKLQQQQESLQKLLEQLIPTIMQSQKLMENFGGFGDQLTGKAGPLIDMVQSLASKFLGAEKSVVSDLEQKSKKLAKQLEAEADKL